jgi:hypothetical protein
MTSKDDIKGFVSLKFLRPWLYQEDQNDAAETWRGRMQEWSGGR